MFTKHYASLRIHKHIKRDKVDHLTITIGARTSVHTPRYND